VGLLIGTAMLTKDSGFITSSVALALRWTFGVGAYLFPLGLVVWGGTFFIKRYEITVERVGVGLALALAAFVGIRHLSVPLPQTFAIDAMLQGGGVIGACLVYVMRAALGQIGAAIALGGLLIVGTLLATDVSISRTVRSLVEVARSAPEPPEEKKPKARRAKTPDNVVKLRPVLKG